jgi:uncharacterized protein (TIGR00288 family)
MRAPQHHIAPAHLGPKAGPPAHAPNAALLIDFDNVTMGIRSDLQTELRNLLGSDIVKGKVAVQRAYADWRRYPQYILPLTESSIDLIFAPAYGSSKKNATDIRLAVDAMELVFTRPEIGTIILLSGDSDFSSLVLKLKEYGKYVIGVGIRESSSDLLVMNCDEYYSYNALAGLVKNSEEEPAKKYDPWELVSEAIVRMKRNGDVMRSDRLKQVMQELDPSFDEKNLGMAKFSRFVQEAAGRGLLSVTKLENGQLEVAPPAVGGTSPATAAQNAEVARQDADEREAGETRDREGRRRRGRGRGRDREGREPREGGEARGPEARPAEPRAAEPSEGAEPRAPEPRPAERAPDIRAAENARREQRPPREQRPVEAPREVPQREEPQRAAAADDIGAAGERLTRTEAFDLVRRATEALVSGDAAASARSVRRRAWELLGRDSESLSERNFNRILKDAHDADVIDLRRRGDDFEVAALSAPPVAEQVEAEQRALVPVPSANAPVAPRGMGPRGAGPGRRGGPVGRGAPPPDLLMVGVVDMPTPAAAMPSIPSAPTSAPAPVPTTSGNGATRDEVKPSREPVAPAPSAREGKNARGGKPAQKKAAGKPAPKPREGSPAAKAAAKTPAAKPAPRAREGAPAAKPAAKPPVAKTSVTKSPAAKSAPAAAKGGAPKPAPSKREGKVAAKKAAE